MKTKYILNADSRKAVCFYIEDDKLAVNISYLLCKKFIIFGQNWLCKYYTQKEYKKEIGGYGSN